MWQKFFVTLCICAVLVTSYAHINTLPSQAALLTQNDVEFVPPPITATSSQFIQRNFNKVVLAPFAAAPAPFIAAPSIPLTAPITPPLTRTLLPQPAFFGAHLLPAAAPLNAAVASPLAALPHLAAPLTAVPSLVRLINPAPLVLVTPAAPPPITPTSLSLRTNTLLRVLPLNAAPRLQRRYRNPGARRYPVALNGVYRAVRIL